MTKASRPTAAKRHCNDNKQPRAPIEGICVQGLGSRHRMLSIAVLEIRALGNPQFFAEPRHASDRDAHFEVDWTVRRPMDDRAFDQRGIESGSFIDQNQIGIVADAQQPLHGFADDPSGNQGAHL